MLLPANSPYLFDLQSRMNQLPSPATDQIP
jgi:hypothetical protein